MTIEECRRFYAEEIRAVAHLPPGPLVEAFAKVPREKFLGAPPWQIAGESFVGRSSFRTTDDPCEIYHNVLIALKSELGINNGQPSALATWIAALALQSGERAFHIGCGTGYYTAIMAEVVGSTGSVVAVDVERDLAAAAEKNLQEYGNVEVHHADGANFDAGTCDAIMVNAGVTNPHPAWLAELHEGGRLVLPLTVVAGSGGQGLMVKITRKGEEFPAEIVSMVGIYSSPSVRDTAAEAELLNALESRRLLKLRSIRVDVHDREDSCLVHAAGICLSAS